MHIGQNTGTSLAKAGSVVWKLEQKFAKTCIFIYQVLKLNMGMIGQSVLVNSLINIGCHLYFENVFVIIILRLIKKKGFPQPAETLFYAIFTSLKLRDSDPNYYVQTTPNLLTFNYYCSRIHINHIIFAYFFYLRLIKK